MSIYDLIEQQRAALLRRDAATLAELTRQWAPVAAQIERQALALATEVARRQAAGESVSQDMLFRLARYREFARQVRSVVGEYGGTVAPDIARAQREAFDAGVSDAVAQLREMGVSTSFTRLPVEATNVIIGAAAGSPLRDLIAASWPNAVDAITGKLIEGVALGRNPRVIAREMAQASGMSLARALNVARTEQIRAYRESSRQLYQQAGITQYRRISAKSARTCPLCLGLDGRIYDTQNAMHSHPSCRCTSVPIVPGYKFPPRQSAAEWFAGQDEDTQRAVLGPGRLDLYRRGVPLGAMVELYDDPKWGPQTRARTLAQINADPTRIVDMGRLRPDAPKPKPAPLAVPPQPATPKPATVATKPVDATGTPRERLLAEARARREAWLQENAEGAARINAVIDETKTAFRAYTEAKAAYKRASAADAPAAERRMLELKERWAALAKERDELQRILTERGRSLFYVDNPANAQLSHSNRFTKDERAALNAAAREFARFFSAEAYGGPRFVPLYKTNKERSFSEGDTVTMAHTAASTLIHEMGHVAERGALKRAILEFYERRTKGSPLVTMAQATGNSAYGKNETTRVDKFLDPYMGKLYKDGSTELLSMGVEFMYSRPWDILINDADYYEFLYVLLRGGYGVGR